MFNFIKRLFGTNKPVVQAPETKASEVKKPAARSANKSTATGSSKKATTAKKATSGTKKTTSAASATKKTTAKKGTAAGKKTSTASTKKAAPKKSNN